MKVLIGAINSTLSDFDIEYRCIKKRRIFIEILIQNELIFHEIDETICIEQQLKLFLKFNSIIVSKDTLESMISLINQTNQFPLFTLNRNNESISLKYSADNYYLVTYDKDANRIEKSQYTIYNLEYLLEKSGYFSNKLVKSFEPISMNTSILKYKNLDSTPLKEIDFAVFLPHELVKEFFLSFLMNFHVKNVGISQSLFKLNDLDLYNFYAPIDLQILYPSNCNYDLEGNKCQSRYLLKNGILTDFLYYRGYENYKNEFGDVMVLNKTEPNIMEWIDIKLSIKKKAYKYSHMAIWEESYLTFDPNSKNVLAYLVILNENLKTKNVIQTSLKFDDFIKSLSQYNTPENRLVPDLILEIQ